MQALQAMQGIILALRLFILLLDAPCFARVSS